MHIEKNFFENVFNTVLDVDGKTKDNPKSREDLKEFCRHPELHVVGGKYPKTIYTLNKESKKVLCEWVKNLKFPDGYVSNMERCVDMNNHKLFGMKSHDCHVFMQRLIPIAFRELLPTKV
uniref:TdcA1-ORF2 protein n=1 Tax=Solanum tuberosum TaxID=4113 RepID=M1AZZ2_SOLTU